MFRRLGSTLQLYILALVRSEYFDFHMKWTLNFLEQMSARAYVSDPYSVTF